MQNFDPRTITTIGAGFVAVSFLFLGPAPFLPFVTSFVVCIISLVIHGIGFAATLVSGFALAHREAVAHGLPDNLVNSFHIFLLPVYFLDLHMFREVFII